MKKAAARLIKRAERARVDPSAFFTFAAREEHTRERIAALPHQRLLLDFVTAHRKSLVRAFVGSSKTYTLGWLGLHLLGNDHTGRGLILGSTADSASKVLSVMRDAIEDERKEFAEVHLTFPTLQRGQGSSDSWSKTKLTVDRPAGIRDASWLAMGIGGALPGARLKWIIADDILNEDNTATPASREKLNRNFGRKVLTRLDMRDAMICVLNTPWEPDDLTFKLEQSGEWPCLSMEVEGEILITNTDWTSDLIRPSRVRPGAWRLAAHDSAAYDAALCELRVDGQRYPLAEGEEAQPGSIVEHFDLDDRVPLWPEKFGVEQIEQIRKDFAATPGEFMAKYKLRPRAPADEGKKRKWIQECKANGRALGYTALATGYRGPNPTFTGVDVATGVEEGADLRAIFTFEQIDALDLMVNGQRRQLRNARKLLNLQSGLWAGAEFVERIEVEAKLFNSMVRVETNAAQSLLKQWLIQRDSSLSVYAHITGNVNKNARITGVAGVLIELENLAWIFPCGEDGRSPEEVEAWFAELLDYRPDRHPGDRLIASWLARAQCRAVLGDAAIPVDLASIAERFR